MNERFAMDKTAFSVTTLANADDDEAYWRSKSPIERIEAIETMRQILYGYSPSERLQRVLEVAELQ